MKRWGLLKCWIGLHDWHSDSDYFIGIASVSEICLFWWTCDRCGKSKLKHITK